jgi:hypothetical protein
MTDQRGNTPRLQRQKVKIPSAGKVMLILLWDCNGLILVHYFEPTTTVTIATSYIHIFDSKPKPVTHNQSGFLLNNNMSWHSATATTETIRQQKTELFPSSIYMLDLDPINYQMFGS